MTVAEKLPAIAGTPAATAGFNPGRPAQSGLPSSVVALFAVACGLSVADVYLAHPLLDAMARDMAIEPASVGIVVTVTQAGYALGLICIVPLGDLIDRRRLIVGLMLLLAAALTMAGLATGAPIFLVSMALVGLLAVVVQVIVAFAAALATPSQRGQIVGTVTSGVVIGILSARFVSGALADVGGWRSVYLVSAVLTVIMAGLLMRMLPRGAIEAPRTSSYLDLLSSLAALFRDLPLLRIRAVLALLIFAAFNVLWAPLVLPLSAPPFSLSHTAIGLIGFAGVAGAFGARQAGRFADRGLGQRVTGLSLGLMLIAWVPIALMGLSLWSLLIGVVVLDFAIQALHVTSQSMLFAARPQAGSRLVAGYMSFYSIGSAAGGIASTAVYASAGWFGVCALGAAISAIALVFFYATARSTTT
jgi:predicted MFS family arabinose efflux permease